MVFRRRSQGIRPVNRIKHVVDSSGGLTSTSSVNALADTVTVLTDPFNPVEVELGSTINGMFISIYVIGSTGAPLEGPIDWYIGKGRASQTALNQFPDPGVTGTFDIRNQIFHEEKGLSGSGDGTPMVFKGVIAIPKGMRRMRSGDSIFIKIKCTGADVCNFCIKAIYNSYK